MKIKKEVAGSGNNSSWVEQRFLLSSPVPPPNQLWPVLPESGLLRSLLRKNVASSVSPLAGGEMWVHFRRMEEGLRDRGGCTNLLVAVLRNSGKDQGLCLVIGGVCVLRHLSRVQLFATPWTVANQVPLSMGFSRQESWSGLPCLPLGDLPDPGTEPASLTSPSLAGGFSTASATWEAPILEGGKASS